MVCQIKNIILILVMTQTLFGQEPQLHIKKQPTGANEPFVIELVGAPNGVNQVIVWSSRGEGNFQGTTVGKTEVTFIPTKSGDFVIIVCVIRLENGQQKELRLIVDVPDKQAATGPPAAMQPMPPHPNQGVPAPNPPQQAVAANRLPEDAVPIARLFGPNEAVVEATGFMGDAVPDEKGNRSAFLGGGDNCPYGQKVGCWSLRFRISDKGKGWAGFAWQIMPQGATDNWGQYPGKDLRNRQFRSIAVFAQTEPNGYPTPQLQFKSGGNIDSKFPKRASFLAATAAEEITTRGRWICLDLMKEDLSYVVSPFTVVVSSLQNPLDADIRVLLNAIHFSPRGCDEIKKY
jgi:hypothetical protein